MTAYSSFAAGTWQTTTNWTPNGTPGAGDTVSITHAITSASSVIIGNSPVAGTVVLTIASPGSLTFSGASSKLTIRGDALLNNAPLTMGAGTILEIDGSASAVQYKLNISSAHNQASARLNLNGTSGSRVTVQSNAGGPNGIIGDGTGPWLGGGMVTATFFDYVRIGDATHPILSSFNSATTFSMTDGSFTSCGKYMSTYNISADAVVTFQRCVFKSTVATETMRFMGAGPTNWTSGVRLIDECLFDKFVEFYTADHATITNNQFYAGFGTTDAAWLTFDKNFVYKTSLTEIILAASTSNSYFYVDNPSGVNPHFVQSGNYLRNFTHTGDVFQFNGTDGQGDCFLSPTANPASAVNITINNCLFLKSSGSTDNSGTPVTFFGAQPNVSITFEKNTYFIGTQGFAASETGAGTANSFIFRSNIGYDDVSARGYKCQATGVNGTTDLVTAANANYNCGYQYLAGTNLKGYNKLTFSSGSPGANDINANPNFTDATVNLEKWDLSLGGPGTLTNALTQLKKRNDPAGGYNSNYNYTALIAYIRAGMAPTNQALKNAGFGSIDIGAVAVTTSTSYVVPNKAKWLTNAQYWFKLLKALTDANPANDTGLANVYYDAQECVYNMRDYEGASTTFSTAMAQSVRAPYRDYWVIGQGAGAAYRIFGKGLAEDYVRDGTQATSKTAVTTLASVGGDPYTVSTTGRDLQLTDIYYSRECAYALMVMLESVRVGNSIDTTQRDKLKNFCLGHITNWGSGHLDGLTKFYLRPFMVALTTKALIQYHEQVAPLTAPQIASIVACWEYIWNTLWNTGNALGSNSFSYTNVDTSTFPSTGSSAEVTGLYNTGGTENSINLNLLIFPVFGWCWKQTGDTKWQTRCSNIFSGGVSTYDAYDNSYNGGGHWVSGAFFGAQTIAGLDGKSLCQNHFWAYNGILYAEGAAVTTPVAPTSAVHKNYWGFLLGISGRSN